MSSAIARVTSILCVPYGYTVTLWCAGAMTAAEHGAPGRLEILMFAAGAVGAFLALSLVGRAGLDREVPMRVPSATVANAFPLVVAGVVSAVPWRGLAKPAAFFATGCLATAAYVLCLALLVRATVAVGRG